MPSDSNKFLEISDFCYNLNNAAVAVSHQADGSLSQLFCRAFFEFSNIFSAL